MPNLVRLIWSGRELKDDHTALRSLSLPPQCTVHATRRAELPGSSSSVMSSGPGSAAAARECQPSTILAAPRHAAVLFDLLKLGVLDERVGDDAWLLLAALPVSDDALRRLRSIELDAAAAKAAGTPPLVWSTLLDASAPLTLLYTLQIVHGLLNAWVCLSLMCVCVCVCVCVCANIVQLTNATLYAAHIET
jgi:hypothetical protein